MSRLAFLLFTFFLAVRSVANDPLGGLEIMTVSGPIPAEEIGQTLTHEHVLVDFGGAATAGRHRYDADKAFDLVLPYLQSARSEGVRTFVECTPEYLGRDVELLRRLSDASGVRIVTNTGYYGAVNDKFVPEHAYAESAETISARWIAEWRNGIDGSEVRPGFIKTAFDRGAPSAIDLKLFRAAALAHLQTGLTIATHTGGNPESVAAQLAILQETGVSPAAWIWVHAHNADAFEDFLPALAAGGWISLDGVRERSLQKIAEFLELAREQSVLSQFLLSHDAGWYRVGEPSGGPDRFRGYTLIHEKLIPLLKSKGFTDAEIGRLTEENPARAFAVRTRPRSQ